MKNNKRHRRSLGFIGAHEQYNSIEDRQHLRTVKALAKVISTNAAMMIALNDVHNPHLNSIRRISLTTPERMEPLCAASGDDEMMSNSPRHPAGQQ